MSKPTFKAIGASRIVRLAIDNKWKTCPRCGGSGRLEYETSNPYEQTYWADCDLCFGEGEINESVYPDA